ncbi:unnamed protein product [Ectocarpus sp. CCAP 1310/34]|nr:unnamed protein product [Ectocarpus sp. CCAP 1310/34]
MWGSLNLGSIRDAAAKLKDGLEAQMDEAMQQSGPVVVRAGPGLAGEDGEDFSPGSPAGGSAGARGMSLTAPPPLGIPSEGAYDSPVARVAGLQLGGGGYGSGEGGRRGSSSSGLAGDAGESGVSPPPSPPPRTSSRLGAPPDATLAGGMSGGGAGRAETGRQRRERLKRERAIKKKQTAEGGGGGGAAIGKDSEKPSVRRLPTSPDISGVPANVTDGTDDASTVAAAPAAGEGALTLPPLELGATAVVDDGPHDGGEVGHAPTAAFPPSLGVTGGGCTAGIGESEGVMPDTAKEGPPPPRVDGLAESAGDRVGAAAGWGDVSLEDSDEDVESQGKCQPAAGGLSEAATADGINGGSDAAELPHATPGVALPVAASAAEPSSPGRIDGASDDSDDVGIPPSEEDSSPSPSPWAVLQETDDAEEVGNTSGNDAGGKSLQPGEAGNDQEEDDKRSESQQPQDREEEVLIGSGAGSAEAAQEEGEAVEGTSSTSVAKDEEGSEPRDDEGLGEQEGGGEEEAEAISSSPAGEEQSPNEERGAAPPTVPLASSVDPDAESADTGDAGAAATEHDKPAEDSSAESADAGFEGEAGVAEDEAPGSSVEEAGDADGGGGSAGGLAESDEEGEEDGDGGVLTDEVRNEVEAEDHGTDSGAAEDAKSLGSATPEASPVVAGGTADTETEAPGGEDLAAAAAAAREREDALMARLLVAEELLLERERQLESTNLAMAEIMQNGGKAGRAGDGSDGGAAAVADLRDRHAREVSRLEGLIEAEKRKGKAAADAVRSWETKAEEFEEKDKMLKAYMDEGAMLAFKQSEMEKTVRKARGALRGVQEERDSLAKENTALQASLAGLREQLRAKEEERASQTQSLAAMGAVSQASSHRLNTAEKATTELEKLREALSAKKAALDKSWAETKELKRSLAELRAEKDALTKSLEDGGKAQKATESQLQQWQDRESTLLREQSQLQETLERVRREADRREDDAKDREEDIRRRWKEAVGRAEALQAEAHESTAPLLRQVRSLQEEMRLRQEAVRAAEASLTDRAASAELACREAERRRRVAEAAVAASDERAHKAEGEVESLGFKLTRLETSNEELKAKCDQHAQRASEVEVELSTLKESSRASALKHKSTEAKLRLQLGEAEDRAAEALRRLEGERRESKDITSSLKEQLDALRRGGQQNSRLYGGSLDRGGRRGPPETWSRRDSGSFSIDDSFAGSQSGTPRAGVAANGGGGGGGGAAGASFAEVERLHSLAKQRQGQVDVLQQRLEAVQATRDALTEEVTSLGRRNTELEALAKAVPLLRDQALELQDKNGVLLDLLGEKTEDLEAVQADMREMQNMYRAQYDELLTRAGAGVDNGTRPPA